MSNRITQKDLERVCERLNQKAGFEKVEWNTIGSYKIDGAYGGVSLHKVTSEGGGITDVFSCGHVPKKDLYYRMQAFLAGSRI